MKIQPTQGYVLIKPLTQDKKTKSGIIIPIKTKTQRGRVLAKGKYILADGAEAKPEFKIRDIVIYRKWEPQEIKVEGFKEPLLIVKYENILAVEVKDV